jgi:hypothetical protein
LTQKLSLVLLFISNINEAFSQVFFMGFLFLFFLVITANCLNARNYGGIKYIGNYSMKIYVLKI